MIFDGMSTGQVFWRFMTQLRGERRICKPPTPLISSTARSDASMISPDIVAGSGHLATSGCLDIVEYPDVCMAPRVFTRIYSGHFRHVMASSFHRYDWSDVPILFVSVARSKRVASGVYQPVLCHITEL